VLGPFYESMDVTPPGWPVSSPTGGITVDAGGDLYIGFADNAGQVRVEMYTGTDSGAPNPARTIVAQTFSTYITSITIGPALAGPALTPTLYVGSPDHVFAFDANASGNAAPRRTIGSFYSATNQHYGGGPYQRVAQLYGIATTPDGTLATTTNTDTFGYPQSPGCDFEFFTPSANGTTGQLSGPLCRGYATRGIARGVDGELDVLMTSWADGPIVQRIVNRVTSSSFVVPGTVAHTGIAVDGSGDIFLSTADGRVEEYPPNSINGTQPTRSFALPAHADAMCFAPDGTLYVATGGDVTTPTNPKEYIYAFAPGTSVPARTLGPYPNRTTALACDSQGRLYVAVDMWDGSGTKVKVFAPNANGTPPPQWILYNPVPANDPGGQTITSLALTP
jgi:hypothetical protein